MTDNETTSSWPTRPVIFTALAMGLGMAIGLFLTYILLNNQVACGIVSIINEQQIFL